MRRRGERPGHSATTAHFQAAYPFQMTVSPPGHRPSPSGLKMRSEPNDSPTPGRGRHGWDARFLGVFLDRVQRAPPVAAERSSNPIMSSTKSLYTPPRTASGLTRASTAMPMPRARRISARSSEPIRISSPASRR
jgi:hypothetical protein